MSDADLLVIRMELMHVFRTLSASASEELTSLATLSEVIGSLEIPSSLELVSCLLETLNKITSHISPDVADRRYVEQLIMSAVENVVQNFPVSAKYSVMESSLIEDCSPGAP